MLQRSLPAVVAFLVMGCATGTPRETREASILGQSGEECNVVLEVKAHLMYSHIEPGENEGVSKTMASLVIGGTKYVFSLECEVQIAKQVPKDNEKDEELERITVSFNKEQQVQLTVPCGRQEIRHRGKLLGSVWIEPGSVLTIKRTRGKTVVAVSN